MDRVQRFDLASGTIGTRRRTPQGGLIVDANLTRTGVLTYVQPDGSVQRELRHPDEVFHADSLATLEHAPLTIDHPEAVTPENWRDVAVGHVSGKPKRDGKFLAAELRIHDQTAIDKAERGKLQELSCGYSCHLDRTPGEYQGEPYDAVQREIRYNHVAAGPAGWGRAGPEVRMRLDGGCGVSGGDPYVPGMTPEEKAALDAAQTEATKAKGELEKARKDAADAKTEAEKAAAKARQDAAELATAKAENDFLKLQMKKLTEDSSSADAKKKLDAAVNETIRIRADGVRILGEEWKADDKDLATIKREVVAHLEPEYKLDALSAESLDAVYSLAVAQHARTSESRGDLQDATIARDDGKGKRPGGEDDDDETAKAYDAMCARNRDAWKTGKKFDRMRARDAAAAGRK